MKHNWEHVRGKGGWVFRCSACGDQVNAITELTLGWPCRPRGETPDPWTGVELAALELLRQIKEARRG